MKFIISLLLLLFLASCGGLNVGSDYQENLKRLDQVHGYCDNPIRNIKKGTLRYKICKDKEKAAGADGIIDDEFNLPFSDMLNRNNSSNATLALPYNRYLWEGSLAVLAEFPLKNVDSQGGYLETEYIYEKDLNDKRCVIKVNVTSTELLSTGVTAKVLCQNNIQENWVSDGQDYQEESKQLTLSILTQAAELSNKDQN
jgi:hypothetical protein